MSYAKAIYPYQTGVSGDLELQVDDIIEVLAEVDHNWLQGRTVNQIGLVPRQFVQKLPKVQLEKHQSLYVVHTNYQSSYPEDLQIQRGDLLIVDESLSNGWFRGRKYLDPQSQGIFPHTFVNLIKASASSHNQTESVTPSSQNDLICFESDPIKFVRVICDIKSSGNNELTCFEDEILAVIQGDLQTSEYLTVKNSFNSIGKIHRQWVEPIDERQADEIVHELLQVPKLASNPPKSNRSDPIQELADEEFKKLMTNDDPNKSMVPMTAATSAHFSATCSSSFPHTSTLTYAQAYSSSSLTSSYINSNNNNNILDVQSLYTSLPLNQFTTQNHYVYTGAKQNNQVCHTPSSASSVSSFDELPPPVKPRQTLRPQLPPPPPPPPTPPAPTLSSSVPIWRGPTRPAPKPPVQAKLEPQRVPPPIGFQSIINPFSQSSHSDETNSIRDSCDFETSSTRSDFFDQELQNLRTQLARDDLVDKTDTNIVQRRRQHVISELLSTERDYLHDLDLLIDTFLSSTAIHCPEHINKNLLFGNLLQINEISRRLLQQLEIEYRKSQQSDDVHCCIGQVFNGLVDPLKSNYAEYCRNHEFVHVYLRKNSNDEKLQQYLQEGLTKVRLQKSTVFDITSLLLLPIQRIVRYPLILNELLKNTTTDHLDYASLKEAINNLISMANYINEFKRRKEIVSKYQRREKDEALTNKLYKLNMHTMRKKSARISMRLSSAFGLSAHTIDERFNFEEQRFRAIDKFLRLFVRNAYICMEALKENLVTQVTVAEDFRELLADRMPDLAEKYLRLKRSLLENAFAEFCSHMDSCVANPVNTLIKLFVLPSNLISKRHDKLLDFDSAQSAYERSKEPQSRQAKHVLDLAKKTYEALNNQLLEELPMLYDYSCQVVSICLKAFLLGHYRLMKQIQTILNQISSSMIAGQLSWLQIVERFSSKTAKTSEQIFQLTITAKNFTEKLKHLPPSKLSSFDNQSSPSEQSAIGPTPSVQTDEIRRLIRMRYPEIDLYTVIRDYTTGVHPRPNEMTVRSGDLVAVINSGNNQCLIDNGVNRALVPRSILIPLTSGDRSGSISHTPPTPLRHDLLPTHRSSLFTTQTTSTHSSKPVLTRANTEPHQFGLFNSAYRMSSDEKENGRIYLNQVDNETSAESHAYASIDLDETQENETIYVAMYDFQCTSEGVLSLSIGEKLRILRRVDDAGNDDWWYVEKLHDSRQCGYVPANYIQPLKS